MTEIQNNKQVEKKLNVLSDCCKALIEEDLPVESLPSRTSLRGPQDLTTGSNDRVYRQDLTTGSNYRL